MNANTTTSADGTPIAYLALGDGPTLVLVGGATNRKEDWLELAGALAADGFTCVTYDRRGRGDSGDTLPYAVDREIEDLVAVIAANGGSAGVHGVSSGGALANRATAARLPVRTLSTFETPYRVGDGPKPPSDYLEHLEALYGADDRAAMVEYLMVAGVGESADEVAAMRTEPFWPGLVSIGRTVLYDGYCLGDSRQLLPSDLLAGITVPVLTMGSTGSPDWLRNAARAAAEAVPDGRYLEVEGEFHSAPTKVLAPALAQHHRA